MDLVALRRRRLVLVAFGHWVLLTALLCSFLSFFDLRGLHPLAWYSAHAAFLGVAGVVALAGAAMGKLGERLGGWLQLVWMGSTLTFTAWDRELFRITRLHLDVELLPILKQDGAFELLNIDTSVYWRLVAVAFTAFVVAALVQRAVHKAAAFWVMNPRTLSMATWVALGLLVSERAFYAVVSPALLFERSDPKVILPWASWVSPQVPVETIELVFGWRSPYTNFAAHGVAPPGETALRYPGMDLESWQPPSEPTKKNILVIAIESFRAASFSPEVTPNLWSLSQDAWVAERHFSSSNCTHMGLFSLLSGLSPRMWSPLTERSVPLATYGMLQRAGYELTATSSLFPTWFGLHRQVLKSELALGDFKNEADPDAALAGAFATYLEKKREPPFFAFLFFNDTHYPYIMRGNTPFRPYRDPLNLMEPGLQSKRTEVVNRYHNALHTTDAHVGRILDTLRRTGQLEHTVIAITGDHGESFWEDGTVGHSTKLSVPQLHVPLIIRVPGEPPKRFQRLTSHPDVMPTLFQAVGLEVPSALYSDGEPIQVDTERPVLAAAMDTGEPESFALLTREGLRRFRQVSGKLRLGEFESFGTNMADGAVEQDAASILRILRHANRWWPGTAPSSSSSVGFIGSTSP